MEADDDTYPTLGPRKYLDRFLDEYDLAEADVADRIRVEPDPRPIYSVHESLMRSHGEFPCAGDHKAEEFCGEIADAMTTHYGITRPEAVARVNRQWSDNIPPGRVPRVWIVGLDIVYHEEPERWAGFIYFGDPDFGPHSQPLPSPLQ